jgi:predicted metalloendopeptidase
MSTKDNSTKDEQCLSLTEAYLPVVLDSYYINQYVPTSVKAQIDDIAKSIKREYLQLLGDTKGSLQYVSPSERYLFLNKLDSVKVQSAVPENWPIDRSTLHVTPESFVQSVLEIRRYHIERNFRLFVHHVLDSENINGDILFDGLVSMANANYQHQINTVTLNAGLIQPPIFSPFFDDTSLYSRYGVLVAHEFTHSIDNIGVLFDTTGTYNPWLSPEGYQGYRERLKCIVDLYTTTTQHGNYHDGKKTLNENVADITAFQVAYSAFQRNTGPTLDQRRNFFVSYAQLYCESSTKSQEMAQISAFSHSVSSLRVNNVVSQHTEFENLWSCKAPTNKQKCSIF